MSDVQLAIRLLFIGMVTVFVVLMLVVQVSKLLIWVVNQNTATKLAASPEPIPKSSPSSEITTEQEIAVLAAVVDSVTSGNGHIKQITQLPKSINFHGKDN